MNTQRFLHALGLTSVALVGFGTVVLSCPVKAQAPATAKIQVTPEVVRQVGSVKSEPAAATSSPLAAYTFTITPATSSDNGRGTFLITSSGTIYMNDQTKDALLQNAFAPVAPTWTPTE